MIWSGGKLAPNGAGPFRNLVDGFLESLRRFPDRPALVVDGRTHSYAELSRAAGNLAKALAGVCDAEEPLVALLAHRSSTAYAGVLAALLAGKGYVPLNPAFPPDRLRRLFTASGCRVIVAGRECLTPLKRLLLSLPAPVTAILADGLAPSDLGEAKGRHHVLQCDTSAACEPDPAGTTADAIAYLLFTSGSTGEPKGVPVRQGNVTAYVRYVADRYQVSEQDRFSQHFDLTFDLSVHDMFVCWERGSCLYSVPEKALFAPAKFIREHELTMWFCVPSVVGVMRRLRMLKPGVFPSLRYSLFCGEPLPADFAQIWQDAAPNSVVENLYGPTEATIAISHYRWDRSTSPSECLNGIAPIGSIFDGQRAVVLDADGTEAPRGASGELALSGSQVTGGYWNDPTVTQARFVRLPAFGDALWYRTGDLVQRDEAGCLYFLGRLDDQIKIRGYRVELQEIDHALRTAAGTPEAVCVPWPVEDGRVAGVVAFVCKPNGTNETEILQRCRELLPEYMVPAQVHFIGDLPRNVNGKVDRSKLQKQMEEFEV